MPHNWLSNLATMKVWRKINDYPPSVERMWYFKLIPYYNLFKLVYINGITWYPQHYKLDLHVGKVLYTRSVLCNLTDQTLLKRRMLMFVMLFTPGKL